MPLLLLASLVLASPCVGVQPPVGGPIVEGFAPIGRYAGHWGIDYSVPERTVVRAADDGVVTFAGVVAGNRAVTIDHGGLRTSYSFLSRTLTERGRIVGRGEVIALSGWHRGRPSLHFSTRIGASYVDPVRLLRCSVAPGPGLWLASTRPAYPLTDAGDLGRYLRPTTHGTSRRR